MDNKKAVNVLLEHFNLDKDDVIINEFMQGMLYAIRYDRTDIDKNIIFKKGYDFYDVFIEELYSRNGNKLYTNNEG